MRWLLFLSLLGLTGQRAPGGAASPPTDPPSIAIDPPPGEQDYIAAFPVHQWTYGRLLWQSRDPCTADRCEAAYNADPVFILVTRQKNCCGSPGYSLQVTARIRGCAAGWYYLVFSEALDRLPAVQRETLADRKVAQVASGISEACHTPLGAPIDPLPQPLPGSPGSPG